MKKKSFLFPLILALILVLAGCTVTVPPETTLPPQPTETTAPTEPPIQWEIGYIASMKLSVPYFNENGATLGSLFRGAEVEYECVPDGKQAIRLGDEIGYLQEGASVVTEIADAVPAHTRYVRTAVNLRDENGRILESFAQKGSTLEVTGCDYLTEGQVHMYRVRLGEAEGYILPWYLAETEEEALVNYDAEGSYAIHAARENQYGGGGAADLDYFPREKGNFPDNPMPEECRALYIPTWRIAEVDQYLQIADQSGINAFVVNITDGGAIGYAGDVMQTYCPTGAAAAANTVEDYRAAIEKLKHAGYYVIGRITTFNDSCFVADHPEYAIANLDGTPMRLAGEYWPSPYVRSVWQYKVDLAVEAVELMGFDEIQFDYVRFPDNTRKQEKAGTVDFRNALGESKAQAIQRFLMYAADILHEHGAYVSADVYGESAYTYVTAYGQYWAAISNVADAISGMPYPDHFGASGSWKPWEHPYNTLYNWGLCAMERQTETATPAVVRTWIQAYNAIHKPYTKYGPNEVAAQIKGLRDAGCLGGYMTWNAGGSLDKYAYLIPAFDPPPENVG